MLRILDQLAPGDEEMQHERQVLLNHLKQLDKQKTFSQLQSYQPLVQFYKQFFKSELEYAQAQESQLVGAGP